LKTKAVAKKAQSRCPGRISLSKHADYINSHLLYVLDDRETQVYSELEEGDSIIELINSDFGNRIIKLSELEKKLKDKLDWSFYILKILQELDLLEQLKNKKLTITVKSQIPAAAGLSSSHALMLSVIYNLAELFDLSEYQAFIKEPLKHKTTAMSVIKLCQRVEESRGFKSGLGDQSAQIFSKKGYLTAIKIFPDLDVQYIKIPDDLAFVTVPSFIKADKSTPEFITKNTNIKKYQNLNSLCEKYNCQFLADLHETLTEAEIFDFLDAITDKATKGLALYGLAESKRVKDLIKDFSIAKLGEHLNLSHQAELNFKFNSANAEAQEISEEEKLNYLCDRTISLSKHSGYYHASTEVNDRLQYLAKNFDGVYGSSITGAGFGGNNIVLIKKSQAEQFKNYLIQEFYQKEKPNDNHAILHISSSNDGASVK